MYDGIDEKLGKKLAFLKIVFKLDEKTYFQI